MKDLFVSYEIALQLKAKGFDEPCLAYYYEQDNHIFKYGIQAPDRKSILGAKNSDDQTTAPLYQQVIAWFRNTPGIRIKIIESEYYSDLGDIWYVKHNSTLSEK